MTKYDKTLYSTYYAARTAWQAADSVQWVWYRTKQRQISAASATEAWDRLQRAFRALQESWEER